jgi:MFS family permease
VLLLCGLIALGLFLLVEARVPAPLLQLAMFRHPVLGRGFATSALVSTVLMTTHVVGPFYLSRTLILDPAGVGLVMSIGPLVAALVGIPAGRAVDRFGASPTAKAGLAAILLGSLVLVMAPATSGIPGYLAPLVLMTAGYALFQAANNTAVMTAIPTSQRGLVSGMLNLSRNLGLITGASAMGAVFALGAATPDVSAAHAEATATGMRLAFAVSAGLMLLALGIIGRRRRLVP